jgi:hypothetical protein
MEPMVIPPDDKDPAIKLRCSTREIEGWIEFALADGILVRVDWEGEWTIPLGSMVTMEMDPSPFRASAWLAGHHRLGAALFLSLKIAHDLGRQGATRSFEGRGLPRHDASLDFLIRQ